MNIKFLPILFSVLLFSNCKKEEINVIKNNVAPPDQTIEKVIIENYVNKLYISLLGEKPTQSEFENAVKTLEDNDLDSSSRKTIVNQVLNSNNYIKNEVVLLFSNYLNNTDSADIEEQIAIYEFAKTLTDDPYEIEYHDNQISRLTTLSNLQNQLLNNSITYIEAHKVIVNNTIYDNINMGSENFVVSLFQNFYNRYPTNQELNSGKDLFDGKSSIFLLKNGGNIEDLRNIFFSHLEFYEGQVTKTFLRFLYRNPSSEEVDQFAKIFFETKNYQKIQEQILISDEYVGIKK